jgi:hypothetical protein
MIKEGLMWMHESMEGEEFSWVAMLYPVEGFLKWDFSTPIGNSLSGCFPLYFGKNIAKYSSTYSLFLFICSVSKWELKKLSISVLKSSNIFPIYSLVTLLLLIFPILVNTSLGPLSILKVPL